MGQEILHTELIPLNYIGISYFIIVVEEDIFVANFTAQVELNNNGNHKKANIILFKCIYYI